MAEIRPTDVIARKWANVTPQRSEDYRQGVEAPRKDWARQTAAAAPAWADGVQKAVTNKSFEKGVSKAGTQKWQQGAVDKGVARWGPGVQLAEDNFLTGFAPFREAIARVQLPPRFARRDPRNLERVKAVVDALKRAKESPGG